PALVHEAGEEGVCLVVGDSLLVVDATVQGDVDAEGQESHAASLSHTIVPRQQNRPYPARRRRRLPHNPRLKLLRSTHEVATHGRSWVAAEVYVDEGRVRPYVPKDLAQE